MRDRIRRIFRRGGQHGSSESAAKEAKRQQAKTRTNHNLFDAAATYISAAADDDHERMDEAAGWVSPEALSFGVSELATRAVLNLARERGETPEAVARALLDVPAAERVGAREG
ncbi:hypothetical protein [Streptomyces sp. Da 82-17]|uniref:hypothetical protein n=1 Tax=Streptomyces sp. Da 82-17 TaxID=3377116 RepID=UPI0038D3CD86